MVRMIIFDDREQIERGADRERARARAKLMGFERRFLVPTSLPPAKKICDDH